MRYHFTCNTDTNYAQHCAAMLCSLFENNRDIDCCVHILTNNLSDKTQAYFIELARKYDNEIIFHIVDESQLENLQYRQNRPLTKAAYYRILLPSIIPDDIEKILYLDCDMIVLQSIKELFDIDLTGYALAATDDTSPYTDIHRQQLGLDMNGIAFCSGIMMVNLKYWRENGAQEHLLRFSKKKRHPVYLHDQDALNHVFRNKWFAIPPKFNHTTMSISPLAKREFYNYEYAFHPVVWHYSSDLKPWFNISFPGKEHYVKYLSLSKFPNPNFDIKGTGFKINVRLRVLRYYVSRYVYPLIPSIIEILIKDIYTLALALKTALFSPKKMKKFIFELWEKKQSKF